MEVGGSGRCKVIGINVSSQLYYNSLTQPVGSLNSLNFVF